MKSNINKRVFEIMAKYKLVLILSFICAIISVIANLSSPILIGKGIDEMLGKGKVNFNSLLAFIIALILIYCIGNLFSWVLIYLTNKMAYKTSEDMRNKLFNKINEMPLKFFDTNSHGDIISRFINDMDSISDGILQSVATFFTGIITIVGAIGFMVYISKVMTIVILFSAAASYFVARFITKNTQRLFKEQAKILGQLNGYSEEFIGGQKVVQAFRYEEKSINDFKNINSKLYDVGVKAQFYGALSNPSTRLVNNITYAIIGTIGCLLAIAGKITVGDVSSFLIYSTLFGKPFNEITGVLTQIQGAMASFQRVLYILDMESESADGKESAKLNNIDGNISFKDVNFSYVDKKPLITDLNLNIKANSKVAIVGKTGAGKTTLVNLLMRFYDVNSGNIKIDGININDISRSDLRGQFGMVLQDTWLFSGTIRDNIAYGKADAQDEEIIKAAKEAGAHSFIRRLSKGYDTVISGDGETLSAGEKQLITIARMMLINPSMLILDEATSSIDTRTEIKIQRAFEKIMKNKTTFIIAHRLSTIKEADLILVMDNGNIVESGNHKTLIEKGGYYARLLGV